jgi:hypothetical protein
MLLDFEHQAAATRPVAPIAGHFQGVIDFRQLAWRKGDIYHGAGYLYHSADGSFWHQFLLLTHKEFACLAQNNAKTPLQTPLVDLQSG